jgi:glycosyltransferase involved in cell wall biosynthesis
MAVDPLFIGRQVDCLISESESRTKQTGPLLTIGVPTFNRASKLARLLDWLDAEVRTNHLEDDVAVFIANNASTDNTLAILDSASSRTLRLRYATHHENLGFDRNAAYVYQQAATPYVWFMGDDDLPLSGALHTILDMLRTHKPDVLIAPFIQPPGSWRRELEFPEPYRLITDAASAIDIVDLHSKLSSYVLRTFVPNEEQRMEMEVHAGAGWMFQVLAFNALQDSPALKLILLPRPVATCDDEFNVLQYSPLALSESYRSFTHSFVRKWAPRMAELKSASSYRGVIRSLCEMQMGDWVACDPAEWREYKDHIDWRWRDLWSDPIAMVSLLLLKTGTAHWFRKGPLAVARRAWKAVLLHCREAAWLSSARSLRRRLRTSYRLKRNFGNHKTPGNVGTVLVDD